MRLYLHRQDIQSLNDVSEKEALKIMKDIREEYKLPEKRYISMDAYCRYFKVNKEDVHQVLHIKSKTSKSA